MPPHVSYSEIKPMNLFLSPTLNTAINLQIGREFAASQQYVALAAWFATENLPCLAEFFFQQATEEREHALKFAKYILETGGKVEIPALPAPKSGFGSVEEGVQLALDSELEVTRMINDLMTQAVKDTNYAAQQFFGWFVTEQVEEVASMEHLLSLVRRANGNLLLVEAAVARMAEKK